MPKLQEAEFDVRIKKKVKIEHNKFGVYDKKFIITENYNWTKAVRNLSLHTTKAFSRFGKCMKKQRKLQKKIQLLREINDKNMELFQKPKIVKLPVWRWNELSNYNGFSGQKRINDWQIIQPNCSKDRKNPWKIYVRYVAQLAIKNNEITTSPWGPMFYVGSAILYFLTD